MQATTKKKLLRIVFAAEVILFFGYYFCGSQGLQHMWRLQAENNEFEQNLAQLITEITALEQQIHAWNTQPFYKEKMAREQLQMACAGEQIYYLH